eukprot:8566254-Pyramimonas_sp.AAC.1
MHTEIPAKRHTDSLGARDEPEPALEHAPRRTSPSPSQDPVRARAERPFRVILIRALVFPKIASGQLQSWSAQLMHAE